MSLKTLNTEVIKYRDMYRDTLITIYRGTKTFCDLNLNSLQVTRQMTVGLFRQVIRIGEKLVPRNPALKPLSDWRRFRGVLKFSRRPRELQDKIFYL